MKTSSIGYRVADFLRRYPPFNYIDETELLELVQGGRVQFHEDGETVFQQSQRHRRFVYVIQQGVVRLVEERENGVILRDVRGEGDMLGVGQILGMEAHAYTALTDTDVILYALPVDRFESLMRRHPRVTRFLAAYFSVASGTSELEGQTARGEELRLGSRPTDWMDRLGADLGEYPICPAELPAREVAGLLARTGADAAAIVDQAGAAMGLVTHRILSEKVATGSLPPTTPAGTLVERSTPVAGPGLRAGDYMVHLLNTHSEHLLVTADGTLGSRCQGIVSRRDLTRVEGAAPLSIIGDMVRAPNVTTLGRLRIQSEAVLAAGLTGPDALRWLSPVASAFTSALFQRVVALVEQGLEAEAAPNPGLAHCWVLFGSAGRGELLTRHDLDHGLIYEDPPENQERAARSHFLELGRRVSAGLVASGFVTSAKGIVAGHPSACRSVTEWRHAFSAWIQDPIMSSVYRATSYFDLRPACGDCYLADDLVRHIHQKEDENPRFVPLLANDSMENLPPLTFIRDLVVNDGGTYADTLDVQHATLQPIVDMARALALDGGCRDTSTLARLAGALTIAGEEGDLLRDAAAAFRIALYHRARNGITNGTDGHRVDPTKLTRFEQNMLKNGFRTVLQLMEYTARHYGLSPQK